MILYLFDSSLQLENYQGLVTQIEALAASGLAYKVVLPSDEGDIAEHLRARNIEFDVIPLPVGAGLLQKFWGWSGYFRKLFRYFRMYPFQVVHASGMQANLLSIALKVRFNSALVWQLWWLLPSRLSRWVFQQTAAVFCDYLIAATQNVAGQMDRSLRWRRTLSVFYRGYELDTVKEPVVDTAPASETRIAMAGPLAPWRGHKAFLKAIELLRRDDPSVHGLIFYYGLEYPGFRNEINRILHDFRLVEFVTLVEIPVPVEQGILASRFQQERVRVYVNAGILLEPFDAGVPESTLAGIPVVASRSGALSELVVHESTGLLVPTGDSTQLAKQIQRLLRDERLVVSLVRAAWQQFPIRFNRAVYVEALKGIYSKLQRFKRLKGAADSPDNKGDSSGSNAA